MSANPSKAQPLSVREREHIRNRLKENEQALKGRIVVATNRGIGPEGLASRRQGHYEAFLREDISEDKEVLRKKIERDRKILEMGDPQNYSKRDRTKMEQQVQLDREFVQSQMCPKSLYRLRESDPQFNTAVEACRREHTKEYSRVASRLKANLRRLDPDGDSNLEKYRPN